METVNQAVTSSASDLYALIANPNLRCPECEAIVNPRGDYGPGASLLHCKWCQRRIRALAAGR